MISFPVMERMKRGKSKLTSVKDSVKTLGICKKINKTLTQKQKVVVLIKLARARGYGQKFYTAADGDHQYGFHRI